MHKYRHKLETGELFKDELFLMPSSKPLNIIGNYTFPLLFVVNTENKDLVADEDKRFIESILSQIPEAKANLDSIGIINLKDAPISLMQLVNQFKPQFIISWDCASMIVGTSNNLLQPIFYGELGLIHCHSIPEMKENKAYKGALWNSMKVIFKIS